MVPPPASLSGGLNRPSLCAAPLPTSGSILLPPRLQVALGGGGGTPLGATDRKNRDTSVRGAPALPSAVSMVGLLSLLLLPLLQASQEVWQSPSKMIALEGDSVNITCSTPGTLHGIYLKQTWPSNSDVIYYEDGLEPTVDPRFQGRIAFSGLQHNLTVSLYHLQLADTGGYTCVAIMDDKIFGPGTLVMVTDQLPQAVNTCQESWLIHFALPTTLAVSFFLIGLGLGAVCVLKRTQLSPPPPPSTSSSTSPESQAPLPVQGQGERSIPPSTSPRLPPGPCLRPPHPGLGSAGEPMGWPRTLLERLHAGPQIYYESFLRGNALKTEDAPERAAPVGRQQALFQIQKLCCAQDMSPVYVVYEDMSHSRCNTTSIPGQCR